MKLNDILTLPLANRYLHPGDPGAILPICIGDFLSPTVNSSATEAGGMLPATLIDVTTWTYCLNAGPSAPDAPEIYVENVRQNPSVYTYNPSDDYEGHGVITTLTFNTDPAGRNISWRGKGLVDGTGALITNPMTVIEQVFTTYGTWQAGDFDPTTVPDTRGRCDDYQYTMHWVFDELQTYRQWLTDLLMNYLGDLLLTYAGQVAVVLDEVTRVDPGRIMAHLRAGTDLDSEMPEDAVEWDLDRRNLCNTVIVRYQYSWSQKKFTAEQTFTHERSIQLYGATQPREILLPGVRTLIHAKQWAALFLARYALLPAMVRFPVKTLRYLALMPSNYLSLTWRAGPDATGQGWDHRLLKVLNTTFEVTAQHTAVECLDTGLEYRPVTYAVLLDADGNTWYLAVSDAGQFHLRRVNPGQIRLNASTWAWIQLTSTLGAVWYVSPASPTDLVASIGAFLLGVNHLGALESSWMLSSSPPAGSGTTAPVVLTSRGGQTWRLVVSDAPVRVFFTVEPRRVPFGGYSWQTEVLGRFIMGRNVLS